MWARADGPEQPASGASRDTAYEVGGELMVATDLSLNKIYILAVS